MESNEKTTGQEGAEQQKESATQPDQISQTLEQLKAENERLKREYAETTKRLADKDTHITQLSNEKMTLEQRFNSTVSQRKEDELIEKEASEILTEALDNPEEASKKLVQLLKRTQESGVKSATAAVENMITQREKVNKLRADNQDLIDIGLEVPITIRANELMQQGRSFDEATTTACLEFRNKLKGKLVEKTTQPAQKTEPDIPAGAKGEAGGSQAVAQKTDPAKDKQNIDLSSEDARHGRLAKSGLY